jgi:hypothetical protein
MKKLTQFYIRTWNWWYRCDIASSTNKKCSLNWKFRHPERKSFQKEDSDMYTLYGCFEGEMLTKMRKFYRKTRRKFQKKHASSNLLSGMISVQGDGISSWESIFYWLMTCLNFIRFINIYILTESLQYKLHKNSIVYFS